MKDKRNQRHLQSKEANSALPDNVIHIDEGMIQDHLDQVAIKSIQQTLNALLNLDAYRL